MGKYSKMYKTTPKMGTSINGTHHIQYMAGIGGKRLPVFLDFVSQFKEQFLALIFPFEEWLEYNIPLLQI